MKTTTIQYPLVLCVNPTGSVRKSRDGFELPCSIVTAAATGSWAIFSRRKKDAAGNLASYQQAAAEGRFRAQIVAGQVRAAETR